MRNIRKGYFTDEVRDVKKAILSGDDGDHGVEPLELCPEVRKFAEAMERKLRENEHKGGWKECGIHYLLGRTLDEIVEFKKSLWKKGEACLDEAADVANYLMMICDVQGKL